MQTIAMRCVTIVRAVLEHASRVQHQGSQYAWRLYVCAPMDRHAHHHDKKQLTFRSVQHDHPNNEAKSDCITMLKQCWERHSQVRLQLLVHHSFQCLVSCSQCEHMPWKRPIRCFSVQQHTCSNVCMPC